MKQQAVFRATAAAQSLGCVRLFVTPRTTACQTSLCITTSRSSLKLTFIESVMPSNHLTCRPHLLPHSIFTSIGSFPISQPFPSGGQSTGASSFSISPSNEYSRLISFRRDWLDLLAVQETLKCLLQHHSSKVPILRRSAFFIVQLSHQYTTTGKIIAPTRWTFVGKGIFLLFNMLSRLVIAFLSRSKRLLISRLQSPATVILKPRK